MADNPALAFVTGASSGLGATFARQLAAKGYDLVLVARRAARLDALAAELQSAHRVSVETVQADLERDDDVSRVAALLAASDRLALLVNNAGFGTKGYFWQTDPARQEAMHRLHVLATERLTCAALPGMVARKRGAVINVSSVAGFLQSVGNISYCSTKAWMNRFTEGLWMELRSAGSPVVAQALCPGFTYTEFHDVMQVARGEFGKSWWMSADFVVSESLRALEKGTLFVIPGWRYRWLVRVLNALPGGLVRNATSRVRKPRL